MVRLLLAAALAVGTYAVASANTEEHKVVASGSASVATQLAKREPIPGPQGVEHDRITRSRVPGGWLVYGAGAAAQPAVLVPDPRALWERSVSWEDAELRGQRVRRLHVPEGWLVNGPSQGASGGLFFLPDPGHTWRFDRNTDLILSYHGFPREQSRYAQRQTPAF